MPRLSEFATLSERKISAIRTNRKVGSYQMIDIKRTFDSAWKLSKVEEIGGTAQIAIYSSELIAIRSF